MTSPQATTDEIVLSSEQKDVIEDVKKGRSVFITGSAGVGKSLLLQKIIDSLPNKKIYKTASTGVAACNIGGSTLHSFAGIGLGEKPAELYAKQILYKRFKVEVKERWEKCGILVIDEISMIDGHLFEKVEAVAKLVRKNKKPFGGIQLILCGDFLQLPPVKNSYFAFETKAWKQSVNKTIVLNKVFRQKHFGFISLLNRLRVGHVTSIDIEVLHHCHKTLFPDDGIKATCLFPLRATCDKVNQNELIRLPGKLKVFDSIDFYQNEFYKTQIEQTSRFPKRLILKEGAQVMLLCNKDVKDGLVNGARGVVVGFHSRNAERKEVLLKEMADAEPSLDKEELLSRLDGIYRTDGEDDDSLPIVRFVNGNEMVIGVEQHLIDNSGKTVAYRTQLPLALAWAVSVHKSQGVTLDRIEVNLAKAFEHGQSYVALSRVTSLDGLLLRAFDPNKITAHPKVLAYYTSINPSFLQCTKSFGEEELRAFIQERQNFTKYKQRVQELTRLHKLKQEDASRCLQEHDYAKTDDEQSRIVGNGKPIVNVVDLTGDSPCKQGENSNSQVKSSIVKNETPVCTNTTMLDSAKQCLFSQTTDVSPPNSHKILSKADEILKKCKQTITHLHDAPKEPTSPDAKIGETSNTKDVVDLSLFNDDSNDEIFEEELCKTPIPKTQKTESTFFDKICPDLLKSAASQDCTPKRGRKRPSDESCTLKENTKMQKSNIMENQGYVQLMLKEKEWQIEEKRRKALAKRYNALKRANPF